MNGADPRMEFYKRLAGGAWITQGVWVAAELGVADHLVAGPLPMDELAAMTGADKAALYRVMRALASVGVFAEDGQGRFGLTPLAELLRSDVPCSQRAMSIMMGSEFHATWGELLHTALTGEPGFEKRFGQRFFEYMLANPARHAIYDNAMTGVHGAETVPVLDAYDFGAFGTVADIGGGNGLALAAMLERHPRLNGILYDLPEVAERARASLRDSAARERIRVEGGDFFKSVPAGADAYVLRHIIHDWQDPDAVAILGRCREAMKPDGRVLVIEMVLPPGNEPGFGKWLDIMMLLVGGRERTREEYAALFEPAGLRMSRIIPTASDVSIIEGLRH